MKNLQLEAPAPGSTLENYSRTKIFLIFLHRNNIKEM